ncbi:MAG TPA: O-antigen ligase family protein [Solirubrobacterales bacterium]
MPSIPTTTARFRLRAVQPAPDLLRTVVLALAVLALELVLAHSAASPQTSKLVILFVGVFAVALLLRFPLATALALLAFTDFLFVGTYFAHQVGPVSVRPHEVALACLVGLAVLKPVKRTWGGATGAALAIFLALVTISAMIAVKSGRASLTEAFNAARPLALLTLFWVVIRLFPESRQRRQLLLGAAVIAAATGIVAVLASVGVGFARTLSEQGEQVLRSEANLGSVDRVRLPGLSLGYALFWYSAVQIVARRSWDRALWSALLVGIGLDIVVSFNRNMWIGIVLGMILMVVFGGAAVRSRITLTISLAVAAVAMIVIFGNAATTDRVVAPVLKRGETILNPSKTASENSLQDRAKETRTAWATAQENLLFGVGAGAPFGVNSHEAVISDGQTVGYVLRPQLFLHNQYLYLLLIGGIGAPVAFVLFLGRPVVEAFRRRPRDPAILACGIGIALIMVSAVVAIYFTVEDMTAVLGVLAGVITADTTGPAADGERSGLLP